MAVLLLFYGHKQADNADDYKAVLEQLRQRYVHGHPLLSGGKKEAFHIPPEEWEGLTAYRYR